MRTYKVTILDTAQRELEEIARVHLELVGPVSAGEITNRIYSALERLKTFSLPGFLPKDRQLHQAGYRFILSGKYICVCRLIENTVFVYHIVHGVMDYPQMLKDLSD